MSEFLVKKATLYRSGIGWFAAEGKVDGDTIFFPVASTSLDDFLKTSLIRIKESKVAITNISFETKGLEKKLFATDNVLLGMFDFLKGSEVIIKYDGTIEHRGKIIGYQIIGEEEPGYLLSLLTEEGKILHLDALGIREITPTSEKNLVALQEYATSLTSESDDEQQTLLKIQLNDTGQYTVVVSFLSSIPAWKLAYRFIISEEQIHLDTYGIIDNNTLVDWKEADITLSTKTPVSFRYDLSTPHIITRQEIEREETPDIVVPELEAMPAPAPMMRAVKMKKAMFAYEDEELLDDFESKPEPIFEEQANIETGESIEYHLIKPVTIRRKQSSMVPLAQATIIGEKKHYYNKNNHLRHPFFVIEFENNLDYAIEGGPVSVYEQARFVGEAMLSRIGKKDKYLLSYALDKNVTIMLDTKSYQFKEGIHIEKLIHYETFSNIEELKFEISNKSNETVNLYIAVPKKYDYKPLKGTLHKFTQNLEYITVPNEYRLIVSCEAYTTKEIQFYLVRETVNSNYLYNLTQKTLEKLLKDKSIGEQEKTTILAVFNINVELDELKSNLKSLQEDSKQKDARRAQIINTLEVLGTAEEKARKKYIEEIEKIDEEINLINRKITNLRKNIDKLSKKSKSYNKLLR